MTHDSDFLVDDSRAERIARSESARKNRKLVKDIKNKRVRKEQIETQHLMEKHQTLMKAKKEKRKKETNDEKNA